MIDQRTIRLETSFEILTEADELLEKGDKLTKVCAKIGVPKRLYASLRREYIRLCREEAFRLEVLMEGNSNFSKLLEELAVNDAINKLW